MTDQTIIETTEQSEFADFQSDLYNQFVKELNELGVPSRVAEQAANIMANHVEPCRKFSYVNEVAELTAIRVTETNAKGSRSESFSVGSAWRFESSTHDGQFTPQVVVLVRRRVDDGYTYTRTSSTLVDGEFVRAGTGYLVLVYTGQDRLTAYVVKSVA